MRALTILGLLLVVLRSSGSPAAPGTDMHLELRKRIQPYRASDAWLEARFEQSFAPAKTAILITDMWDKHWCRGATERVGQIAVRMEPLLERARAAGVLIIHAPSETMDFYAGSEGRRLALSAPHAVPPDVAPVADPPLPIDDSNGGCDTPGDVEHRVWTRQTPLLTIARGDVISDSGGEIYNILRQRGIETVFYMGVHANMCILNRSFGIRQLARWGIHCILVRDLTDAMYESSSRPFVSHASGTELVIEYIEQYWAPTVNSVEMMQALAGMAAREERKSN
jgi:nicotinamidase-related amidase